jgi:alpha-L-rhamnosidase
MPWQFYCYYGDERELKKNYKYMKAFVDYYYSKADSTGYLTTTPGADHQYYETCRDSDGCPAELDEMITSAICRDYIRTLIQVAQTLGKQDDIQKYEMVAAKIRDAVNQKYYDRQNKSYGWWIRRDGSIDKRYGMQSGNAVMILSGIAPQEDIPVLVDHIIRDMDENYNGHFVAGRCLYQVFDVLTQYGHIEKVYEQMSRTTYPSFGHMLSFGQKTITEGFSQGPCLVSTCQFESQIPVKWFQQSLCGLGADPQKPGFKHFVLRPYIPDGLNEAALEFKSNYGKIESSWKKSNGRFLWTITVPPNSAATVWMPAQNSSQIKEGGQLAPTLPG